MKKLILPVLILLASEISHCQEYIDVLTLPKPDSTGSIYNSFYDHAGKIMVLSDKYGNDSEYKRMFGYFLLDTALRAKKESELTEEDYKKPLLIFGPVNGFKRWEKFEVAVKKTNHGFNFLNKQYPGKNDGVFYCSPARMVYTGNSLLPVWELQSQFQLYHYTIVSNNERVTLGEYLPDKAYQVDLISIRNNNYRVINTKCFKLYVSKKLDPDLVTKNIPAIDSVSSDICNRLQIKPVSDPIVCYVHSEPNEATFFANFYNMQGFGVLPRDRTFGTVFMKQLHCVGFSVGLIKHEGFHAIWEESVGLSINSFFSEGIQEYYQWGPDTSIANNNLKMLKKHLDYDMTDLVVKGDMQTFWGGPAENNWPIAYPLSGLFVKYLVDTWGLEKFKEMYVIEDKNIACKKIYNKSVGEIITDFRNNVLNK
ncbi:MAG: hypothetical protein NT040_16125 [Bacteroidetes bacterium]|nr:hypothetical protein [Bacteroidota bacterium]